MKDNNDVVMIMERHASSVAKIKQICETHLDVDHKYIVMVYDDETSFDRKLSFISNAPERDVQMICKAVAEQMNPGGIVANGAN